MERPSPRTRFAPSPTGDLHLGGLYVAIASWWLARRAGGTFVVRMEDIDTPRVVPGASERILEDLAWVGLDWDEYCVQSERRARHEEALSRLAAHLYSCDCSRAEIARVASAPHEADEHGANELVYPGTCRAKDSGRVHRKEPSLRVRVPEGRIIEFVDQVAGMVEQRLDQAVGDFVVRRADGVFAYQLVVVVDDIDAGITDVVRGDDLLFSTARQIYLHELIGAVPPRYWHLPLVRDTEGERLAKRTPGATIRELRERGVHPEDVVGVVAHSLGIATRNPLPLRALLSDRDAELRPTELRVPEVWARAPR